MSSPGSISTKPTIERPAWAIRFSPQVRRSRFLERPRARNGPTPSTMMIGMTRKVITRHARSRRPPSSAPAKPARSRAAFWIVLMMIPTTSATIAHGAMAPIRFQAPRTALGTVGSPPVSRSWAP